MKKKTIIEILLSVAIVLIPTFFIYNHLAHIGSFWNSQSFWSITLAFGWIIVAAGYFRQGTLVEHRGAQNVSFFLPAAVFCIQCVLFVKGVYYKDWSLIWGALVVNSGVVFSLYHILKARKFFRKR